MMYFVFFAVGLACGAVVQAIMSTPTKYDNRARWRAGYKWANTDLNLNPNDVTVDYVTAMIDGSAEPYDLGARQALVNFLNRRPK